MLQRRISFQRSDIEGYKAYLETHLAQHQPAVHSVQMVLRENLYGFQGNQKSPYLKITVTDPKYINRLRTSIEDGGANYKGMWKGVESKILTFDSIQYVLRFMIDTGVTGMSWVGVPAQKYHVLPQHERQSNCQIEAYCHYRDLIAHGHDGEWAKMAPLRILSFDIECAGRKGIFPRTEYGSGHPDRQRCHQVRGVKAVHPECLCAGYVQFDCEYADI